MPWCEDPECEAAIKEETKATIRVIPFDQPEKFQGTCPRCGKDADKFAVYAKAY
jgi:prolyl-tRNA synthetase